MSGDWGNKPSLTAQWTLPCGHVITQTFGVEGALTPEQRSAFIERGGKVLSYWMQARWERHDCALVSPENPYGINRSTDEVIVSGVSL